MGMKTGTRSLTRDVIDDLCNKLPVHQRLSRRVFCRMRTIQFPETFPSPLELNVASNIIIKMSTRRRRSVDSDWSADFFGGVAAIICLTFRGFI